MPRYFSIRPSLTLRGRKFKGIRGLSGKPFHPPLTDIPIGAYVLAGLFDAISMYMQSRNESVAHDFFVSATHLLIAGAIVSIPTIITGFWDWLKSTPPGTQAWRTANWHMAIMLLTSILVAIDILLRWGYWHAGYTEASFGWLTVAIAGLVSFGALYGGAMVYEYAFNVEQDFDHAYAKSEVDKVPGRDTEPKQPEG